LKTSNEISKKKKIFMVTCKALVTRVSDGKARLALEDILVVLEQLPDHQVLVRTQSVAQNPIDGVYSLIEVFSLLF
jgi:hypothetical protein